jgi:two-component system chemotaxis response regulator CheB
MVVEDSTVVRQLLSHIIGRDPRLQLVAAVASAEEALQELDRIRPDVISMDIRLPGIDGLEATRRIMSEHPTPIVVIADSVNEGSLKISMNALKAGALTVVEKPVGAATTGYDDLAETICTQLYIMSEVPVIRRRAIGSRTEPPEPGDQRRGSDPQPGRPNFIAIAASTGGPPAFARILGALPANFPVPILLVQHMGAPFMEGFASWLDGLTPLGVALAQAGETPAPGHVYVAPGGRHLLLGPRGTLVLTDDPPLHGQRPSATTMFRSLARVAGSRALGVLLTGMGEDGASGLAELRQAGGYAITEHASTTVVNGMPAAAVRLGGSSLQLPLDQVAGRLLHIVGLPA